MTEVCESGVRSRRFEWDFSRLLNGNTLYENAYAIVMLNTPIPPEHAQLFSRVWNSAAIRIVADGGANVLREFVKSWDTFQRPTLICGDLDSISADTHKFFVDLGVCVKRIASQDSTDLQKSIQALEQMEAANSCKASVDSTFVMRHPLVIYGGLGSRLDQSMHTLHVLAQLAPDASSSAAVPYVQAHTSPLPDSTLQVRPETILIASSCVSCLLTPGTHELVHDRRILGKTCGLLPLGVSSARISTQGLEWNLRM